MRFDPDGSHMVAVQFPCPFAAPSRLILDRIGQRNSRFRRLLDCIRRSCQPTASTPALRGWLLLRQIFWVRSNPATPAIDSNAPRFWKNPSGILAPSRTAQNMAVLQKDRSPSQGSLFRFPFLASAPRPSNATRQWLKPGWCVRARNA